MIGGRDATHGCVGAGCAWYIVLDEEKSTGRCAVTNLTLAADFLIAWVVSGADEDEEEQHDADTCPECTTAH